ncbi:MAG: hypothetical protein U0271_40540 [Polyangiaceae bacterium]
MRRKILLLTVALSLALPSCDKFGAKKDDSKSKSKSDDDDDDDDGAKKKKKKKSADSADSATAAPSAAPPPAPSPAPTPAPAPTVPPAPTATNDSTGVPECDVYLDLLARCIPTAKVDDIRAAYKLGISAAGKDQYVTTCQQGIDGLKKVEATGTCKPANSSTTPPAPQPTAAIPQPVPTTATTAIGTPSGKSPVPTVDEWASITREVTVTGSSTLNCETKMLREWLRVSCRGKNNTGGTPTGVEVTRGGGGGNDYVLAGSGFASLVVRFYEGVDLEAEFSWTDQVHTLKVSWPRNTPEPVAKAAFVGVGSSTHVPAGSPGQQCGCPSGTYCCYGVMNDLWCGDDPGCPTG